MSTAEPVPPGQHVSIHGKHHHVDASGTLDLYNLGIKHLSEIEGLEKVAGLRCLLLSHNELEEFVPSEAGLAFEQLRILGVGYNHLQRFEIAPTMRRLTDISLDHNQLESIDGLSRISSLLNINASNNLIHVFPDLSTQARLKGICFSENKLVNVEFPESCSGLNAFNLNNNLIEHIRDVSHMGDLEVINLAHNRLRDTRWLGHHPRLTRMCLNNNELERLDHFEGLSNLNELYVSRNRLVSLAGLEHCPGLAILHADHNRLAELDVLPSFIFPCTVIASNNQITRLPPFETFAKIVVQSATGSYFDFSDNQIDHITVNEDVGVGVLHLFNNRITETSWLDRIWMDDPGNITLEGNPLTPDALAKYETFIDEIAKHWRPIIEMGLK